MRYHMIFVFLCLTDFSMTIFGSSMLLQMVLFVLFYGWVIFHCVNTHIHMYHIFFILSSVDGHWGCFHVLAIVNNAAMNTGVHVSLQITVFSRYMPRSGTAGSHGSSIFSFSRYLHIVHHGYTNVHSHLWCRMFLFPPTLSSIYCL